MHSLVVPQRYALYFMYVALLHFMWAGILLVSPSGGHATVTSFFIETFHWRLLVAALLFTSSSLCLLVLYRAPVYTIRTGLMMAPQAVFILLAATGAVQAIITGEFGDGVQRSHWFIAADQAPPVVAAVCHQWGMAKTHGQFIRRFLWKD